MLWIKGLASQREFAFVTYVYLKDYPPLAPIFVQDGHIPQDVYNAFNIPACMGLYDESSASKGAATELWEQELP